MSPFLETCNLYLLSLTKLKTTIALGHKVSLSSTELLWCPGPGEDMPLPPKFTSLTAQPSILHFPQPSAPRFQGQPLPTAVMRLICEWHHASCCWVHLLSLRGSSCSILFNLHSCLGNDGILPLSHQEELGGLCEDLKIPVEPERQSSLDLCPSPDNYEVGFSSCSTEGLPQV